MGIGRTTGSNTPASTRRLNRFSVLLFLTLLSGVVQAAESPVPPPLKIGVVPYLSTRALINSYQPLRHFLQNSFGRPVEVYTATGFKAFFESTDEGAFDLIVTPAHFARIAQIDKGFVPLVRYSTGGRGLFVVPQQSRMKDIHDLRGQTIAVPDRLSLAAILCVEYLRQNSLRSGTDFKLLETASFNSAVLIVQKGEAAAAISAPGALAQMPDDLRDSVRILADTGDYTNLVFLANPRLGAADVDRLKHLLLQFGAESAEGRAFLKNTGFGSIIPTSEADLQRLDPYVAETKHLLGRTP
jgi:phosphonate transport system substrate-binding protein